MLLKTSGYENLERVLLHNKRNFNIAIALLLVLEGGVLFPLIFNPRIELLSIESALFTIGILYALYWVALFFNILYSGEFWKKQIKIFCIKEACGNFFN